MMILKQEKAPEILIKNIENKYLKINTFHNYYVKNLKYFYNYLMKLVIRQGFILILIINP